MSDDLVIAVAKKEPGRSANSRYGPVDPKTGRKTLLPCRKCGKKSCECLELRALELWADAGLPTPIREFPFAHPARKWRSDFCWVDARVLVEIEGRGGGGGRHSSAAGSRADMEKYNSASLMGFRVLKFERTHLAKPKGGGEPYAVRAVRAALEGGFVL